MPKLITAEMRDAFIAAIAGGATKGVAAKQSGFLPAAATAWCRRDPAFAQRVAEALLAGKAARRARVRTQTRQLLGELVGGQDAPAEAGLVAPQVTEQPSAAQLAPECTAQRRVPIGRVDAHGILWCDPELLQMAMREAARAIAAI